MTLKFRLRFAIPKYIEIISLLIFQLIFFLQCSIGTNSNMLSKESSEKQAFLNNVYGRTEVINLDTFSTIEELKKDIKDKYLIDEESQLLICNSKILSNNQEIIDCIKPYDTISLSTKLRGGVGNDDYFGFVGFSEISSECFKKFSSTAPSWRVIKSGINFEGVCLNYNCKAGKNKSRVWADIKTKSGREYNRFKGSIDTEEEELDEQFTNPFQIHILRNRCYCPECGEKLTSSTVKWFGFYNCKFHIYGTRFDDEKEYFNMDNTINSDLGFVYFNGKTNGIQKWKHIVAVIEKLK